MSECSACTKQFPSPHPTLRVFVLCLEGTDGGHQVSECSACQVVLGDGGREGMSSFPVDPKEALDNQSTRGEYADVQPRAAERVCD